MILKIESRVKLINDIFGIIQSNNSFQNLEIFARNSKEKLSMIGHCNMTIFAGLTNLLIDFNEKDYCLIFDGFSQNLVDGFIQLINGSETIYNEEEMVLSNLKKLMIKDLKMNAQFEIDNCTEMDSYDSLINLSDHEKPDELSDLDYKERCFVQEILELNYDTLKDIHKLRTPDGLPYRCTRTCNKCSFSSTAAAKYTDIWSYLDHKRKHWFNDNPYECKICTKKFTKLEEVKTDIIGHIDGLKCYACDKTFRNKRKLVQHSQLMKCKRKSDQFCDSCDKKFQTKKQMTAHKYFVHNQNLYKCDYCEFTTKSKSHLKINHMPVHSNTDFNCEICNKSFKNKLYLSRHNKVWHSKSREKTYKCDICDKGFMSKDTFNGHLNMHKGIKPHKCQICEKCFRNKSNLGAHKRKKHGKRV